MSSHLTSSGPGERRQNVGADANGAPQKSGWIGLTHEAREHTGALRELPDLAPQATVVGTWLSFGRFSPDGPLPMDRIRVLNPGDVLNVGDRNLRALRPPLYDSPGTLGALDDRTGALFSSDCFGAPLPEAAATAATVDVGGETARTADVRDQISGSFWKIQS